MQTVDFKLGEKKNVSISIINSMKNPFEVTNATYVLKSGNEVESSGACEIKQCKNEFSAMLSALIAPKRNKCTYILRFTYDIFPETFIYDVQVRIT